MLDAVIERNEEGWPIVMTAHTTVKGCDYTGHEHGTELVVGGIDSFDVESLGEGYDYLALGHIHHEQFVHTGKHNVRYSGSPIPVSFDENYQHSVSIVEIGGHGDKPKVVKIEIENPHPLVTLPSDGMAKWEEAKELLRQFPDDIPAYIRLNVEIDDFLPVEANMEAEVLTENKQCRFCYINAKRKTVSPIASKALTVQEFQAENPIEIVKRYAEDIGVTFNEEMDEIFTQTIQMLNADSHDD